MTKTYVARRDWDGCEPDEENEGRTSKPYTQIAEVDGEKVRVMVAAHDFFEFKPGDAERIVACLNACEGIDTDRLTERVAFRGRRLPKEPK